MMGDKIYDIKIVKEKIQLYCATTDRCQHQVLTKLRTYGVSEALAHEILVDLIQHKFVDEERFARAYSSGKFKIKKWGKRKISYSLSQLKVSLSCIEKGLEEIDSKDYTDTIETLALKKNATLKFKNTYIRKKKIADYLTRKGFESELVWECLHKL
jgi:regulatory protein